MLDDSAQDDCAQAPHAQALRQDDRAQALRLIAAAQRRAGLDGFMLLYDGYDRKFIPLDGIDDFIAEGAVDLDGTAVDPWIVAFCQPGGAGEDSTQANSEIGGVWPPYRTANASHGPSMGRGRGVRRDG